MFYLTLLAVNFLPTVINIMNDVHQMTAKDTCPRQLVSKYFPAITWTLMSLKMQEFARKFRDFRNHVAVKQEWLPPTPKIFNILIKIPRIRSYRINEYLYIEVSGRQNNYKISNHCITMNFCFWRYME